MALYKILVKKVPISPEKKTKQKDYLPKGQLPIIDQGQQLIGGYSDNLDLQLSCNPPVIVFGDHTRAVKYVDFPFGAGADGIKVLQPAEGVYPKFLYYATQYLVLRLEDRGYARHYQYIEKKELDIPSVPEQKRIVARIEELFSQLDNGVETLRKTKQQLTVYRQAVLKSAFGKISPNEYKPLRSVLSGTPQNGLYKPKTAYGAGTRILRIDGFYDGRISEDYDYKRLQLSESEIAQYQLNKWDLVINRVNSMQYLGKCALIRDLSEITVYESNMMRMKLDRTRVDPEYVTHYLSSFIGHKELTKNAKQAVNQASINQTDVGNALIPVPESLEEQRNVVSAINARISVCDNIEKTVDTALQQAEAMRQSILKQAFKGRL